jgi:hypothetical protein
MGFYNLGLVQYRLSGYSSEGINKALELYAEAAKLWSKAGDEEGYAMVQIASAHILLDLYEIYNEPAFGTRAYLSLEEAARFIDKENDPYRYAQLVFERGRLFMRMHFGTPIYAEDAVAAFEEALEIYCAGGYPVETASALLHWEAPAST